MRILIAGKGRLATRAATLVESLVPLQFPGASVEVVPNASDTGVDTWLPSLLRLARLRQWPVHESVGSAGLGSADILLSLQYDRIVDCSTLGGVAAYNLHFAPLPRYRGSVTSALQIRHGESTAGVTLHKLVAAVDAGPIIAAVTFPVPAFFNAYDLYIASHEHAFELLKDNVVALLTGEVDAVAQDDAASTTFFRRDVDFGDAELCDFDRPAASVRDWCRSLIFPPAQLPTFRDRGIVGSYTMGFPGRPVAPGTIVHDGPALSLVACSDALVALELADRD